MSVTSGSKVAMNVRTCGRRPPTKRRCIWIVVLASACGNHDARVAGDRLSVVAADSLPLAVIPSPSSGAVIEGQVAGAVSLRDDLVAVASGGPSIQVFNRSGGLTRTIGRRGQGPGEFQMVSWLGACGGDSLFAYDLMGAGRVTVVDAAGKASRQFTLEGDPAVFSCSHQGTFIVLSRYALNVEPTETYRTATSTVTVTDRTGVARFRLGDVPAFDLVFVNGSWFPRPLGRRATVAASARRLYVARVDAPVIDVYTLDGSRDTSIAVTVAPRVPTRRHVEHAVEEFLVFLPPGPMRNRMKERLTALDMPETLPPLSAIFVDPSDRLWVVLSAPGDTVTLLRVFGGNGRPIRDVRVPLGLRVMYVDRDYLVAGFEDEGGEPRIGVFALPDL